ncbi:3792_t:CDS:2, partial [Dentiscutata heterogama]
IVKKNKDIIPFSNNLFQAKLIETEIAKAKNKSQSKRFWHPLTFYFYSESGTGKSNLVQKLFCSEIYNKKKKQCSESNWWDSYSEDVEIKGKSFVPFLAKYIFMTSQKYPEEAFNFGQRNIDDETSTQHD